MSVDTYQQKYPDLATDMNGYSAIIGAMTFETTSDTNPVADTGWPVKQSSSGWCLRQPEFNGVLEFNVNAQG